MKLLTFLSFFALGQCFSQGLVIVNQNGELIRDKPLMFEISVPNASDTIGFSIEKGRINFTIDPTYSYVKLRVVKDLCVKEYYNEYTEYQFSKLDTLVLFESCIVHEYTPLVQFEKFDNWLKDTLEYKWFEAYLDEIDFDHSDKNIVIDVQSIRKHLFFKKMKTKNYRYQIAKAFGVSPERVILTFNNENYLTRDGDLFISGQKVNKNFVRSQNTKHMRDLAKKYTLVGQIIIK